MTHIKIKNKNILNLMNYFWNKEFYFQVFGIVFQYKHTWRSHISVWNIKRISDKNPSNSIRLTYYFIFSHLNSRLNPV